MTSPRPNVVTWQCRGCGRQIGAPASDAARPISCPRCSQRQTVPRAQSQPLLDASRRSVKPVALAGSGHVRRTLSPWKSGSRIGRTWFGLAVITLACATSTAAWLLWSSRPGKSASDGVSTPSSQPGGESPVEPPSGPSVPAQPGPGARLIQMTSSHSPEDRLAVLRDLASQATSLGVNADGERNAALLRLRMYRFLCGLREQDLTLDANLNADALAASDVCRRLGRLTHDPSNPGVPDHEFERARRGARAGNLAMGMTTLTAAVDAWMDDSDEDNVRALGHRRWCLNPPLRLVGFGRTDRWSVMSTHDSSGTAGFAQPAICFPPPGVVPIDMFRPHFAWSVTLDPRRFSKPRVGSVTAEIRQRMGGSNLGAPLQLAFLTVDTGGYGIDNCIIFRPSSLSIAAGASYWVTISGLNECDGSDVSLVYEVQFVE